MLHPIILMVVGELHVEVENSWWVDEYVLCAERLWIWAIWVSDGVIAGANTDDGSACEEEDEPTEEGKNVHALAGHSVWEIKIAGEELGLMR